MDLDCAALASALRAGREGPVARSWALTVTLFALTAIAAILGGVLLLILLGSPVRTTFWMATCGVLCGAAALGILLLATLDEGYELTRGRLSYRSRLLGFARTRDLGSPSEFAGVALWVERDWVWRVAALTPGGGLLRLRDSGSGDQGKAAGQAAGAELAAALRVTLLVAPGRGPLKGWRPGPTLVQGGPAPVQEGGAVVREVDTGMEQLLMVSGMLLLPAGCLGLYIGYGMYQKSWLLWARPCFAVGGMLLVLRMLLREDLCFDPASRTVIHRRFFQGMYFPSVWCRFEDLEAVAVECTVMRGKNGACYDYYALLVQKNGDAMRASNSSSYSWTEAEVQDLARLCDTRAYLPPEKSQLIIGRGSLQHAPW